MTRECFVAFMPGCLIGAFAVSFGGGVLAVVMAGLLAFWLTGRAHFLDAEHDGAGERPLPSRGAAGPTGSGPWSMPPPLRRWYDLNGAAIGAPSSTFPMSNRNLGFMVGRPLDDEGDTDADQAQGRKASGAKGKRADRSGEEPRATPDQIEQHLATIPEWVRAASGYPTESGE